MMSERGSLHPPAGVEASARRTTSRGGQRFSPPSMGSLVPYVRLMKLALGLGAAIGFAFGLTVLLALAFRLPIGGGWLVLVQVHGQGQIVGFVTIFIMAVGTILFPRFLASPLQRPGLCIAGGYVLAASVVLRAVGQPLPMSPVRSVLLLVGGLLGPVGLVMFAAPLVAAMRRTIQPWQLWRSYAASGFVTLMAGLLLGIGASLALARGQGLVPFALNEAQLHLQLNGFIVLLVLGVALKIFPTFLILRPPWGRAFHPLLALYLTGLVLITVGWLLVEMRPDLDRASVLLRAAGALVELVALIGFCLALRLYEPAERPSGRPYITVPTRRWFRLAFGFLLLAACGAAFYGVREALGGAGAGFTEWSAVRHALTTGFLLPLMAGMAGRILPVYSADVAHHRWLLPVTVWLSFAGAAARVGGEWVGGYEPWTASIVALGGVMSTAAFVVLAVAVWRSTDRVPASP